MKRFLLSVAVVLFCFGLCAEDRRTYFYVGSGICAPITVKCDNGRTYRIYDEMSLDGLVQPLSATDCQGRSIVIPSGDTSSKSGEYHYRYYTFKTLYGGSESSYGSYDSGNEDYSSAADIGKAVRQTIFGLGGGADGSAYPALRADFGISRTYGEFVRLHYAGDGLNMFAGIGKDFIYDSAYKDKILWHAGIGSYFSFGDDYDPSMDIALAVAVSNSCLNKGVDLTINADYTYWIGSWRRIGIFCGAAAGYSDFGALFDVDNIENMGGFTWNVEAGITIRITNY